MSQVNAVRPTPFRPSVQGFANQFANSDGAMSAVRVATPVVKAGLDHFGGSLLSRIGGGATPLANGGFTALPSAGVSLGAGASGGVMTGARGLFSRAGSAVSGALNSVLGALKSNALVAAAVSGLTNGISFLTGKTSGQRAASNFVVDTGAYTAIGASSTLVGAALGTLIPIPFVGTAIGLAAGMGLGYLYEKTLRQPLSDKLASTVFNKLPG